MYNGYLQVVESLVEAGVNVKEFDEIGWTSLHHACNMANPDRVDVAIDLVEVTPAHPKPAHSTLYTLHPTPYTLHPKP